MLAAINWEDRTTTTTIDLGELGGEAYHVFNFWGQRYLGLVRDCIRIERHLPHAAKLFLLKEPSDHPTFWRPPFTSQAGRWR